MIANRKLASKAYGAPYAKNHRFRFSGNGDFGLLGSIPNPQHCKFFAGCASSGCFEVLRFNLYENEYVMSIRC